jgi:hypothetical protein
MRLRNTVMALFLVFTLNACGGLSVTTDFDPGTDFSTFQTWNLMELPDNPDLDQITEGRLNSSIERTMGSKGMTMARGEPDVWLGWQLIFDEEISYNTVNSYYGGGWGYGGWYGPGYGGMGMGTSRTYESRVTVGTLIIDIFDSETKALVWRGVGEGKVHEVSDPNERQRRIDQTIDKIMESFPPSTN